MNDHVQLEIADYLADRLPDDRRRRFEEHMRRCDACREDVRWATEFREEALRQGLRHLDPRREVEIATGHEAANDAERAHLELCPACRAELDWARSHASDEGDDDEEEARAPQRGRLPWVRLLAAAAVVVLAVVWIRMPPSDRSVTDLARLDPLPVRIARSVPAPGSFEEVRWQGLEAYAGGDFATARDLLARATELAPDHAETRLYLGSAELLLGDADAAAKELQRAADLAESTALRDEAAWQAAQAALVTNRPEEAERRLAELAGGDGRRAADARELLSLLRGGP